MSIYRGFSEFNFKVFKSKKKNNFCILFIFYKLAPK
jgi:hypothetical protein